MAKSKRVVAKNGTKEAARSLALAGRGISTSLDFAELMSALMSDLIDGRMGPDVGNAVCNAGGKLLKVVEMQHRYGDKARGLELARRSSLTEAHRSLLRRGA